MNQNQPKTFDLNVKARALHFRENDQSPEYVVFPEGPVDHYAFMTAFNWSQKDSKILYRQATGVNLDGTEERFFMVFVADCFDPPIAIVRADNESDAEEGFYEELPWADVEEADVKDFDVDTLVWSSRGKWVDTNGIQIRETRLVHVELA